MSEEILRALVQLFAITTKQDGGVSSEERDFVINFFREELARGSVENYIDLYDKISGYDQASKGVVIENKATSVRDSVKTLGLCKKINKTLEQKQKIVVLLKMLEVVYADNQYSQQEIEVINTIATVFNINKQEYKSMELYVGPKDKWGDDANILNVDNTTEQRGHAMLHGLIGEVAFVRIPSVEMYFVRYSGKDELVLNGFTMKPDKVYLFSNGSILRTTHGDVLYYSDLIAYFNPQVKATRLSFEATIDELRFVNGDLGLRDIQINEGPGKLVGIMGASGAGKTTLLNVLAGLIKPTKGSIKINGFDINTQKESTNGVIGYVSQDDLLIEELTVYQNLFFNARLCFADKTENEIKEKVMEVLSSLGLDQRKDLRVGSVLDKTISGGQRKRLNIALELIREPGILFLDEPTSGLSSRDSENVIDLLKELSMKGKLIFTVIHQPSSEIYKMFDKMILLDVGGYPVYNGDPVEAVTYFKTVTNQVDKERGLCEMCGNVNPEQIFNIIEARVVDEYGQLTSERKISPEQWYEQFKERFNPEKTEKVSEKPQISLRIPNKIKQALIFTTRDTLSKLSNTQYLVINLLEAPLLALILGFVIRYKNLPNGDEYVYRFNENIPAFLLMAVVVALFMGMTVSAEEIIRDRKILKRESFLNLSWNSYLMSKVLILFSISLIQTFAFVLIGNLILEMPGNFFHQWMILFSSAAFANLVGLNISSAFKSAVTVYVLIPLLLIPQMILSGLLFNFDKLNDLISTKGKVPFVADMMASRWAYEALAVDQFMNNAYQRDYYLYEKEESSSDYKSAFLADLLNDKRKSILNNLNDPSESSRKIALKDLNILLDNLKNERFREGIESVDLTSQLSPDNFVSFEPVLEEYLKNYQVYYQNRFNEAIKAKEVRMMQNDANADYDLNKMKNKYYNESLSDLVKNISVKERIVEFEGKLIVQINPIFHDPIPSGIFDYRSQFFSPKKAFLGQFWDTYSFNIFVIWMMTLLLYIALYFEWISMIIKRFGKIRFRK